MATCNNCGTEIGESKFCPACGASRGDVVGQPIQPMSAAPSPTYVPMQSASPMGDTQEQTTTQAPYTAPFYPQQGSEGMPNRSGQMVFSCINIVLGVITCCSCIGLVTLVLGIIAAVFCSKVDLAPTVEEAKQKLKTVMVMNIIAMIFFALSVIAIILYFVFVPANIWKWLFDF